MTFDIEIVAIAHILWYNNITDGNICAIFSKEVIIWIIVKN